MSAKPKESHCQGHFSADFSKEELAGENVKGLTDRAMRALRCLAAGQSIGATARVTAFSAQYLSALRNSKVGAAYLTHLRDGITADFTKTVLENDVIIGSVQRVKKVLEEESVATLARLLDLRDSADENVAFKASKDILDRAGFKPSDAVELSGSVEASPQLMAAMEMASKLLKPSEEEG